MVCTLAFCVVLPKLVRIVDRGLALAVFHPSLAKSFAMIGKRINEEWRHLMHVLLEDATDAPLVHQQFEDLTDGLD